MWVCSYEEVEGAHDEIEAVVHPPEHFISLWGQLPRRVSCDARVRVRSLEIRPAEQNPV